MTEHDHDHEYLSECCEALPAGELDFAPHGILGICRLCRDPALFVCIQCEEKNDTGD